MRPSKLDEIESILSRIIQSRSTFSPDAFDDEKDHAAAPASAPSPGMTIRGDVAVIPISGVIGPRPSIMTSGGTSVSSIQRSLASAIEAKAVRSILLDIHSPGGSVYGVEELADEIYAARSVKPIHAVANHEAASAAYWLGSQATTFTASPSSLVGSVGVIQKRIDESEKMQKAGVKVIPIVAGKAKTDGQTFTAPSAEEIERSQAIVDGYYGKFVSAVARGRSLSKNYVESAFGDGRIVSAADALSLKMVDRIAPVGQTLSDLQKRSSRSRAAAALANLAPMA